MQIVQTGDGRAAIKQELTKLALKLINENGAETIVLAGTELSLVFSAATASFPVVDCAEPHVDAVMRSLLAAAVRALAR